MQEEHCAIILYPGDEFAGHVVPPGGTANALAEEIEQFIRERGIDMEKVKSLVSDGCEKMVEWEKGVHATLEKIFKVPFTRIICFFHHLEKSFEVILVLYSGRTTSPGSYSSGVGKEVSGDVHRLPVEDFEVLPNSYLLDLIDGTSADVFKSLSNDHQILMRLLLNGQMAHPESVLLATLASSSLSERERAVEVIFRVRSRGPIEWETPSGVRPFKVKSLSSIRSFDNISLTAKRP